LEFQRELEEYMEQNGVYDVFEDMMKSVITQMPKDPVKFLIKKLQAPESKLIRSFTRLKSKTADNSWTTREHEEGNCPFAD